MSRLERELDRDLRRRPSALVEVIESMPAIVVNCRSSGVATAEAIVSGLAPGSAADTWMVGKSTFGRSFTGRQAVRHQSEDEDGRHQAAW